MAPVGQAPAQRPQPVQVLCEMTAACSPPRRSATRGIAQGQASSQAPQARQCSGTTEQSGSSKSRFQMRSVPSPIRVAMWPVGQTSAQAKQPTQSSPTSSGRGPTVFSVPRPKGAMAAVLRPSQTRVQRPHWMQRSAPSRGGKALASMPSARARAAISGESGQRAR